MGLWSNVGMSPIRFLYFNPYLGKKGGARTHEPLRWLYPCISKLRIKMKYLPLIELIGITKYSLKSLISKIKGKRNSFNSIELGSYKRDVWKKKKQIRKEENRENERRFFFLKAKKLLRRKNNFFSGKEEFENKEYFEKKKEPPL